MHAIPREDSPESYERIIDQWMQNPFQPSKLVLTCLDKPTEP